MTTNALARSQPKLLGLELIRFFSALAVLVWHYQHFFYVADTAQNYVVPNLPLYSVFHWFFEYGYCGVQVFWCISGFIFFWKYKQAIAEGRVGPRKFFILRFSRLYPLHVTTLLLVIVLQWFYLREHHYYFVYQINDFKHFVLQLLFASNWGLRNHYSFNGPIWSVSIEVLVYVLFFLLLRHVSRTAWVNVGILGLCLAAKLMRYSIPFVDCLAYFYAGGLAAFALEALEGRRLKPLVNVLAATLLIAGPLLGRTVALPHYQVFATYVFFLVYVPTLIYLAAQDVPVPAGLQTVIEALGNMTYSSYLSHFPIQLSVALFYSYTHQAMPYYSSVMFCAYLSVTLVAAYYVYRGFELPAQASLRRRMQ